ncbi:LysR family transcriptional regulator [Roseateles sp. DAIF2]|uniref:LysR substrate-binding domain-containing protein n=1 Tax=Roseateles sp. DAIF2 TaxID=2714952 RepID=UPI0018A3158B|nr:LysR substrate-binding domain-containing protein [Roseateles sp. DAIF2]QPF73297.1 LysR family transcriptional regulator [Roseateles sp. DAIF2]
MSLPPLVSLRFFEATARHQSVTRAAAELHVTPGAVTQQIRKLEAFLGCALFERQARGLRLTELGRDYQAACQDALALIGRATQRLLGNGRRPALRISCTPGFAAQWLVPRLQEYLRRSPQLDVQVNASNRQVDLVSEGFHFAVRHGIGPYPGLESLRLLDDLLIPVCAPGLLTPRRGNRLVGLAELRAPNLLHDEHREDWRLWVEAAGLPGLDWQGGVVFIDSNAVIEAALAGRGVALLRRSLVQQELATRRLLALRAPPLRTPLAYHLLYRSETLLEPEARRFLDWLRTEAGRD